MSRFENDWERELDRRLRAMPDHRAPAALMSRVLASTRQPAWLRRWNALPAGARTAIVLVASAGALATLRLEAAALGQLLSHSAGPWNTVWRALSTALAQTTRGVATLWWAWRAPLAAMAMASMTACAASAVLAALLVRASQGSASRSRA